MYVCMFVYVCVCVCVCVLFAGFIKFIEIMFKE